MRLNTIRPASGARPSKKRVGRGIGSGSGKTGGRGHKGQHSRSGGYHKVGFEGGQMPLQRRVPKFGFHSRKAMVRAEIRLAELAALAGDEVTVETLRAANLIHNRVKTAKIILSGKIERAVKVKGVGVTRGARAAIEAAGGSVEE